MVRDVTSETDGAALLTAAAALRPRLVAVAARVLGQAEAEDVAQEVLLRLVRTGGPDDPGALRAWLVASTWRLAADRKKTTERRDAIVRREELVRRGAPVRTSPGLAELADTADAAARAGRAVDGLGEPYRTALKLRFMEGLDFPEVARRMGALERTARTWVGRGLTQVRAALGATA
jgi:RNA polymerase sigma-70 factor (ECF subfamily)